MRKIQTYPIFLIYDPTTSSKNKEKADEIKSKNGTINTFLKLTQENELVPVNNVTTDEIKRKITDLTKEAKYKHIEIDASMDDCGINLKQIYKMWNGGYLDYKYSVLFICSFELILNENNHEYIHSQLVAGIEVKGLIFEPTICQNANRNICIIHDKLNATINSLINIKPLELIYKETDVQLIAVKWLNSFEDQYEIWASHHHRLVKAVIRQEIAKYVF